jgi:protein involved in polysaccharide export with SLBB domain
MSRIRSTVLAVATLVAAACASAPSGPAITAAPVPRSFGLRAGDMVRVRIWREPDLSGDFIVDEYGRVTLPLVGAKQVLGESSESLQKKLETDFASSVKDPSVQIVFLRRVSVQGAVRAPGLYPMDATMTVGDALAMAGGRGPDAADTALELWRDGTMLYGQVPTSVFIGQLETKAGDELRMPKWSWLARNGMNTASLIQIGVLTTLSIIQIALITR